MKRLLFLLCLCACQGAQGPQGPVGLEGPIGSAGPLGPAGATAQLIWAEFHDTRFGEDCPWGNETWRCVTFTLPSEFDNPPAPAVQCMVERGPFHGFWEATKSCTVQDYGGLWKVTAWDNTGGAGPVRISAWKP